MKSNLISRPYIYFQKVLTKSNFSANTSRSLETPIVRRVVAGSSLTSDGCSGFQGKMGIFANKPRFTVIDKNPSPTKTVSNFGFLDYLEMTTVTGASVPVGYLAGGRCGLRGSCMYTAGLIGLLGGFMFAYESSAGRLMGLFPNQEEVEKYKK